MNASATLIVPTGEIGPQGRPVDREVEITFALSPDASNRALSDAIDAAAIAAGYPRFLVRRWVIA